MTSPISTQRHGHVLIVTSNNPPVNALGAAVRQGLVAAIEEAEAADDVAAVVIAWRPLWQAAAPQFEDPAVMAAVVAFVIVMTAATLAVWARLRRRG